MLQLLNNQTIFINDLTILSNYINTTTYPQMNTTEIYHNLNITLDSSLVNTLDDIKVNLTTSIQLRLEELDILSQTYCNTNQSQLCTNDIDLNDIHKNFTCFYNRSISCTSNNDFL